MKITIGVLLMLPIYTFIIVNWKSIKEVLGDSDIQDGLKVVGFIFRIVAFIVGVSLIIK